MKCPSCQADNPTGNRFCESCGAALPARGAACAAALRPESRFCGSCGSRVGEAPAGEPAAPTAPTLVAAARPLWIKDSAPRDATPYYCELE